MTNNLKKKSDALVMAYLIDVAPVHFISDHVGVSRAFDKIREKYHFYPEDPKYDEGFSMLVDKYCKEVKTQDGRDKASLLFRSRFKIAI